MMKKIFAPGDDSALANFSLLVLRVWLGLAMFLIHGLDKVQNFSHYASMFPNPIGIGAKPGLVLVVIAETAGAVMLVLGLLTRLGALMLAVDMGVAFVFVHHMAVGMQEHSGELAFIYLAGFVTLFFAGPGKLSMDKLFFGKGK